MHARRGSVEGTEDAMGHELERVNAFGREKFASIVHM